MLKETMLDAPGLQVFVSYIHMCLDVCGSIFLVLLMAQTPSCEKVVQCFAASGSHAKQTWWSELEVVDETN